MSKHTPGPWGTYDTAAYGIHICKGGIAGQHIASAQRYVGLTQDETVANARLIAAAPEMLAALRELLERCDFEAQEMARAAIGKAEGGA
jgi:hypothetical protein